jgi:hypothetical protein
VDRWHVKNCDHESFHALSQHVNELMKKIIIDFFSLYIEPERVIPCVWCLTANVKPVDSECGYVNVSLRLY